MHAETNFSPQDMRNFITKFFNTEELRDLCFQLGVDYGNLPGRGKAEKAKEMVAHMEQHARLDELENYLAKVRPIAFEKFEPANPFQEDNISLPSPSKEILEAPRYKDITDELEALEESESLIEHPKFEISADEIITEGTETTGSLLNNAVLSSLTRVLQSLPFAGIEVLGNFEGFMLIEIADSQGTISPFSEEKIFVLSEGQTYQLRFTIQSKEPQEGIFDFIRLTDGEDIEYVTFTVNLDCDSLKIEPDVFKFIIRAKQTETTIKIVHLIAEKGAHNLFVQISQKNTLVQVIPLKLEIQ